MVSLPGLETYSPEQLEQARALSPAFARYERMLPLLAKDDVHAIRHSAWLKCTMATYFGSKLSPPITTSDVCLYWSETADTLLQRVWRQSGLAAHECALFALGKQGAMELNLSSDIDVLIVAEARDAVVIEKGLRRFQHTLQHSGENGFCFRLDFDLRPGGKMGPLITTPSQFQDYYWSQGETWERLALVRLRQVVGDSALGEQILDLARRFSFRKFLDFTLLDDLKALRAQVHQKGFQRKDGELHLKLEVGGIRDIELFTHSLLVMNGGKVPALQTRSTTEALALLKQKSLFSGSESDFLCETYWYYRHNENIVQSFADRQTHSRLDSLPQVPGFATRSELELRMQKVDQIVSTLLGQIDLEAVHLPQDESSQHIWLAELGFSEAAIASSWAPLVQATALSHKNDRDERARQEFLFTFVGALAENRGLDRDLGLNLLLDFVRATRAKATFFSMLLRTPRLIHDLARLFCLSPYLGSILASRPELLDHFVLQLDENWSADLQSLLQQMSERKLLTELWAANQYLTDRDLRAMFTRVTQTADSICQQLLVQLKIEFPQAQIEIITLGKWAGCELGLRSDLDFIFVTPSAPSEADFKVARRMISRLTDVSRGGSLYDIDLRLRPSGQSGPLLVGLEQLHEYWQNTAQPWERQAYLRARPLRSDLLLRKDLLVQKPLSEEGLAELRDIRVKLLRKIDADCIDIKYAPGGLLDIEFVCQTAILNLQLTTAGSSTAEMIQSLAEKSPTWNPISDDLLQTYNRIREFEQVLSLSATHKTIEAKRQSPIFTKASGLLGLTPDAAWSRLQQLLERSSTHLNQLDPTNLKRYPVPS